MKKVGIAFLVVLGLLVLAGYYLRYTPFALAGVQARQANNCSMDMVAVPPAPRVQWADGAVVARVAGRDNCAASQPDFQVQRLGGLLLVRRQSQIYGMQVGCMCVRESDVRIPGLPQGDYRVWVYGFM